MRYTKLEQPTYLTELDPKYSQMILEAKLEMFDIKINFKGLYPSNLLCSFCNVVNEEFSHMFNCEAEVEMCGKVFDKVWKNEKYPNLRVADIFQATEHHDIFPFFP